MNRQRRLHHGFSLIELLISCAILSIGLVGLAQLYISSMWTYQKAHYLSLATQRAQYELERVENFKFNIMNNSTHLIGDGIYPLSEGYTALPSYNGVKFNMDDLPQGVGKIVVTHYTVAYGPMIRPVPTPNIIRVDITISWQEPRQSVSPVTVYTYLMK